MASTFVEYHDPVEGIIRVELVETKRSPNCFMLWSRHRRSTLLQSKKMAEVSQQQGAEWNDLPEEQKEPFRRAAKMAREEHKRAFPNKPYHSKSGKRSKKEKKKVEAIPEPVQPQQPAVWEYSPQSVSPPGYLPQPPNAQMVQYAPETIPQQQEPQYPPAWEYSPQSVSPPGYIPQPQMMQYALEAIPQQQESQHPAAWGYSPQSVSPPGYLPPPPSAQMYAPDQSAYCYPHYPMPEPAQQPMPEEPAQHQHQAPNPADDDHEDDWFWEEDVDTSPPQQQPQVYSEHGDGYNPYPQRYQYY